MWLINPDSEEWGDEPILMCFLDQKGREILLMGEVNRYTNQSTTFEQLVSEALEMGKKARASNKELGLFISRKTCRSSSKPPTKQP
jgi:hypothetical protein